MIDLIVISAVILAAMVIILAADARRRRRQMMRPYDDSTPLRSVAHPAPHLLHDERSMAEIIDQQGDRYWK